MVISLLDLSCPASDKQPWLNVNISFAVQKDFAENRAVSAVQQISDVQNLVNYGVKDRVEDPVNCDNVNYNIGKYYV